MESVRREQGVDDLGDVARLAEHPQDVRELRRASCGAGNFDSELNPIPVLAQSWKVLDDTTWEFSLQKGVKFHNGNPFTADDVVWSFNRATHRYPLISVCVAAAAVRY